MTSDETLKHIEAMRARLTETLDQFKVEDFKRVHAKFVGAVIALEVGFKTRFPAAWAEYEREFYGEDDVH